MRRLSFVGGTAALGVVSLMAACNEPVSDLPSQPTPVGTASLVIVGPDTLAPRQSAEFTVRIRTADGTLKDPGNTPGLRWRVGFLFPTVLQVNAAGVATALTIPGETTLTAELTIQGALRQVTKEIVIVPEGTYRVVGSVVDAEFTGTPIAGARVEVAGTSLVATTDSGGRYRLYGVPPQATLHVSANGFHSRDRPLQLTSHVTENVQLSATGTRPVLTGLYTLTFEAGDACAGLRPDLHRRSYDATLVQTTTTIDVRLTEPRFRVSFLKGDRFTGSAVSGGAAFTISLGQSYYYGFDPDIMERLSDGTFFTVDGAVRLQGSASSLSGTLDGSLWQISQRPGGFLDRVAECRSTSHQVTLTRR